MAADIPASLKSADIGRFASRAAQVERAKPIIAYWCESYFPQACWGTLAADDLLLDNRQLLDCTSDHR